MYIWCSGFIFQNGTAQSRLEEWNANNKPAKSRVEGNNSPIPKLQSPHSVNRSSPTPQQNKEWVGCLVFYLLASTVHLQWKGDLIIRGVASWGWQFNSILLSQYIWNLVWQDGWLWWEGPYKRMTTVLRRNVDFVLLTADKIKYWHFLCRTDYNEEQKIAHCKHCLQTQ